MTNTQIDQLEKFQAANKLNFKQINLLELALTHRSSLNEDRSVKEHNERLEFLGDAVLELVVTEYLYGSYPNPEGELTNWRSAVVRGEVLARVAKEIGLGELLQMSRGEEKSGGRERGPLLANAFEAVTGAVYLDKGYDEAKIFINKHLLGLLPDIIENQLYIDSKSRLQELSQEKMGQTPSYRVLNEQGPDHSKSFTVGAYIGDKQISQGEGASKQRAEQSAASNALEEWDDFLSRNRR